MKPENFMLGIAVAMIGVVLVLANWKSDATPAQTLPLPGANTRFQPFVFLDESTGCQYLSTHTSTALAPRIAADGKTHMGCKAVAQ